ncbi:histone acetyltransferase [Saccharibacillus sp. O23]|uniref:GNAT family N-acetyltransferase n=1 Tax=Saccharibacillus sp. O23 TaxID=2009338 RepID=UPI000B4E3FF3|nr:GNAT family N-acetyltransferase [Saccharibacillus sp. O23]OWR32574.1 histone acetyltransferase [Saccharibacillus sp. O23]
MITLRNVRPTDLDRLVLIENEGFTADEAATREAFIERIRFIPDTFIVAEQEGTLLGYVNGPIIDQPYITDDLFTESQANPARGGYQSILGLAVSGQARGRGVAKLLMDKLEELAETNDREGITLTCKEELIPFYEKLGFANEGVSESEHGGIRWYNLLKRR